MRFSSLLLLGAGLTAIAMPAAARQAGQSATPPAAGQAGGQTPERAPAPVLAPTTTLRDALVQAYRTSPALASERANLRATDENVPIARSAGLPSVTSSGGYVENVLSSSGDSLTSPARQATASVDMSVPVYSGGAVRSSIRAAETRVEAGRANLRGVEADLFTAVVAAYQDVIRDEAIVRLNQENVHVLEVNLQATRDRFEVGDLTRTDVAQSEARLAIARSQLRSVEAQLIGSRENYIRIVGNPPGVLAQAPALPNLPASADVAVDVALDNNPVLQAAHQASKATDYDVAAARSGRLPRVSVVLGGNYYNYLGSFGAGTNVRVGQDGTAATAGVALQLPLFQGGLPSAQIRQAQARRSAAIEQVTDTERGVIAQTRSAYASWQSAMRVIESSRVAVEANRLSLEGVRAENSVGSRTILDILNAEQELLNSQVQYVTAERDAYVAGFALLASMGRAEARDLGLDGGALYDPVAHYGRVRRDWSDWGGSIEPAASGTRTVDTPAQTPEVSGTLDPVLQSQVDRTPADTSVVPEQDQ